MSTTVVTPQATEQTQQTQEAPAFDTAKYIQQRNEAKANAGKQVAIVTEPEKHAEPVVEPEKPVKVHDPRSLRRQINKYQKDAEYWRGRAETMQEFFGKNGATANSGKDAGDTTQDDAEPQRNQFPTEADYIRAATKWDRAQDAKTSQSKAEEAKKNDEFRAELEAMDAKTATDIETLFPDWDEVMQASAESEDAPELDWGKNPTLAGLFSRTPYRAAIIYTWAKDPEAMQKMIDLSSDPQKQISAFHRLEGKMEILYDSKQAAQAKKPKEDSKDRTHLAEAEKPGEPVAAVKTAKPKPSSVVAATGGSSAIPDAPAPGSPAWFQARNQRKYGR